MRGNGSTSQNTACLLKLFVDQEMLTSALSRAGGAPGVHLCSSRRRGRNHSLLSAVKLRSPGSGPAFNPPPSAARGNATRPKPLPEARHGAAGLATASPQAPARAPPEFPGPGPQGLTFLFLEICTAILPPRAPERKGSSSWAEVGIKGASDDKELRDVDACRRSWEL